MKTPSLNTLSRVALLASLLAALTMQLVHGAETDISNQPLATRPTVQAKPNLLFILDNSGSMNWSYMPDDLGRSYSAADEPYTDWYGYYAPQCNGTAYDPNTTYDVPLMADGVTEYANASFTAAKADGYNSGSSVVNLTDTYYYTYSGTQPRMSWTYTSDGVVDNTFYQECSSDKGDAPGKNVFTKVTMTAASSDAQNYANWYSYYRKRYLLMRTAMGRAMVTLDENYRVGFTTINDTGATEGTNHFRDIKDFNTTQKNNFYSSLYSSLPNGSTPLRTALSKAGRYFAKKISGQAHDPVQYACQRNYALLSTDGYWNGGVGVQLNGTTSVGQQDGLEARPMRDEAINSSREVIPYSASAARTRTSNTQTSSRNWSRNKVTVAATMGTNGCANNRYHTTVVTQRHTQSRTQYFVTPQSSTASYTRTTETTEGVITSGPTDSPVSYSSWSNSAAATTTSTNTGDATAGSSYTDINTTTDCDRSTGLPSGGVIGQTTFTNPSAGSWSSWSPSLSYTNSTPTLSPWVAGTPVITDTSNDGTGNTLADVAQYYYATDLRDSTLGNCTSTSSGSSQNVCFDIVPETSADPLTTQHMNTFTIGLGIKGTLPYTDDTLAGLTDGSVKWPSPTGASSNNSSGGDATNIDDLWHAAINGRGSYYSAQSADDLNQAIKSVVQAVGEAVGASSAASTSSLELVAGENNFVYRASYTTSSWFGDLEAFALNGETAAIASIPTWSAKTKLDAMTLATRKIYFKGTDGLTEFTYANLDAAKKAYFNSICTKALIPAQCASLPAAGKLLANDGERLVNYLRGDRTYEAPTPLGTDVLPALYRTRAHLLGDIINGAPVHVGKPPFSYGDTGYADFVATKASRKPVVYVAANDGMLHALSAQGADGGAELWAYIPTAVMPNLYRLADNNYGVNHQYFVDGAPVMGDIQVGGVWKTILVGGLNRGGASYYALDITDPTNPVTLWEFTDANMGYTYGNPIITKRADGTWIVALTSGYNNTSGDGKGHLYVLNANTGDKLLDLATTAGSAASPSGLSKINAWVEDPSDNTATRFYGGDLQGNVWRFDIDNLFAPNQAALLLAELKHSAASPQPITTKPMTVEVSGKPVVIVATGRYLGDTDIVDSTQQSIYAIKDPLTAVGWGDVRTNTEKFVQQTLTVTFSDDDSDGVEDTDEKASASVSEHSVDWANKGGWRIDLPHAGERVFSNMGLQLGTLVIGTAVPNGDACSSGGSSWRYYLNVSTGSTVSDNPVGVKWSPMALIVGISWVKDTNGNVRVIFQQSDSTITTEIPPTAPSAGAGSAHRTSWRELAD